jgi:hypothetical protein
VEASEPKQAWGIARTGAHRDATSGILAPNLDKGRFLT